MGHKIHPLLYRISNRQIPEHKVTDGHGGKWFAMTDEAYRKNVLIDHQIREFLRANLSHAGLGNIVIDRPTRGAIALHLEVVKPGIVIGHRGKEIDILRDKLVKKFDSDFAVNVQEIRKPDAHALCIASKIARQLEARVQYRRAMRMAVASAMRSGIKGINITCKGRISQIARPEKKREGSVPLSTLREVVHQHTLHAKTRSGKIGVRVTVSYGPRTAKNRDTKDTDRLTEESKDDRRKQDRRGGDRNHDRNPDRNFDRNDRNPNRGHHRGYRIQEGPNRGSNPNRNFDRNPNKNFSKNLGKTSQNSNTTDKK